ncbi:type II toxin-antitoxin system PemK/MazF family toxin [Streptomyces sp. ALI-76-A]|nr:type II toxin-antitoxin system PemK/MazF family toxin [Streptomyces sp. ALI-76-A]MDL5201613.1 type II toxin-antitoxin system PemK/MazF family toxin [Streptomyces sp. ALI-76-A]
MPEDSEARCEQLGAVAPERLPRRLGTVPRQGAAEIDAALRRHLAP